MDFQQLKAPHSYLNSGDRERIKPALRDSLMLLQRLGACEKFLGIASLEEL